MTDKITKGSVADIAQQQRRDVPEVLMECTKIVILDSSYSMTTIVKSEGESEMRRHDLAEQALRKIQENNPGQVALIEFSSKVEFVPGGVPTRMNGDTDMLAALNYVLPFDDTGIEFILVSDGEPNMGQRESVLELAKKFKSKIHTIFIGDQGSEGAKFLEQIGTGKSFDVSATELLGTMERLMLNGS